MGVVHCASWTVAAVVWTCVRRGGAVDSHVSLTCTMWPVQDVSRLWGEGGCGRLARFADMHHVAGPGLGAFVEVACVGIIGRFDALSSRWQFPTRLETYLRRGGRSRRRWRTRRSLVMTL